MDILHKFIPDNQLHEPKGIVTATDKTVYISTGASTGEWRRIKETDIDYSSAANSILDGMILQIINILQVLP